MAQRHDITTITFQANARGANAAIEALRQEAERCNLVVTDLKTKLKDGIKMGKSTDELDKIRADLKTADKEAKQWSKAYNELIKGMRVLDQGIKAFNDGTLNQMSAAFQKTLYNAAKLTRTKLAPDSDSFKQDFKELTALMDAAQQNFAKLQGDAASMIKTLKEGNKVSVSALREEVNAQKELLSVLSETDKGYKTTQKNVAVLESYLRAMGGDYQFVRQNIQDTQKVSDEMLRNMYTELQKTNAEGKVTKDIMRENARAMKEIRAEQARRVETVLGGDLTKQSEGSIRNAINNAKELLLTYKTGSKEAQALSAQIVNAEEHLKTHGTEAARAAQKQAEAMKLLDDKYKMMQGRMTDLTKLSKSALDETQKFWQAQMDGATKGSRAYKEAERNLKAIAAEQERQATAQLKAAAGKIGRKNLTGMSEQEIQASIAAAKQLAASMKPTDQAYKQLQQDIIRAEEHVKQFGLEAERSSQKAAQQMQVMNDRMGKLKSLSAAALEETKRYWQAQMDGATRGSQAYKQAEANVKALTAEQERLAAAQLKTDAKSIYGNKATMSEGAIRKAIEAARQYQQTLATTDPEYKRLTKAILDAEEHVKKYGIEAERAARKEQAAAAEAAKKRKETDKMMADQLKQGKSLSESALKAQQQYWQRLIDDPKTAATSLKLYQSKLEQVKRLQEQMAATSIRTNGKDALTFFRGDTSNASASQIEEQKKALIAYRDSLPRKTNAKLIEEINGYIKQTGDAAKVAAGDMMSLADAEKLAAQIGTKGFTASTTQLQQAKKALVEAQNAAGRGTKRFRDLQEAINKVDLELAKTGEIAQSVQAVLDKPKGQSINALKQAVEQGRAALANMDRTTVDGQKRFAELAAKIKEADFELKQLTGTAKGSATAFDKAWSRLKTYITLYMGAAVVIQKITATFGDLMELSDKMGEVRKTTGFTADEIGKLSDELKKLDTRTTITGLLDLSVAAGQLGLKTQEDVEGFTIAANKLMVALPEMGKEGATQMLKVALATGEIDKIRRQMEQGLIDGSSATAVAMEKVGSTIDRLRATSAATAPAITDFVKRVGAVGAQSGISIDQVAALGSTVDALGMRVEMSATALSRMIPAIKNNAFDVAKAIGVTPNTLRDLFETGRGMEAVLMIFQKIKDSGMGADDIDKMLGMGNMKEVMKELNQQGARAGIVFAGLSQNVDELRRQLGVAADAYKENIAIQQEYDKMNETTAAKWERLKNVIEELFVGDASQRWLGGIIDGMRSAIDLIVEFIGYVKAVAFGFAAWKLGVGAAIWTYLLNPLRLAITETHSLTVQIKRVAATWRTAWRSMDAATKTNLIMAIGTAVYYLGKAVWDTCTKVSELAKAMAEVDEQEVVAIRDINHLSGALTDAIPKANGLAVRHKNLKEETDALRKEVDELKKSTDNSAEAHGNLSKKTEELEKKEKELKAAEDESNKANKERSSLITEINSKYGTYLGYMLNEETAAMQVAQAHRQIVAALKEEMEQKRMNRQQEAINAKYDEKIAGYQTDAQDELSNLPADIQRRIMNRFNSVLANITFEIDPNTQKGIFRRNAAEGFGEKIYREREGVDNASYASFELMQPILKELIKQEAIGQQGVTLTTEELDEYVKDIWGLIGADAGFWQLSLNSLEKERQTMELRNQSDQTQKSLHATSVAEANNMNADAYQRITSVLAGNQELTAANIKDLAQQVNIITGNLNKYKGELNNADKFIGKDNDATLENAVNTMFAALSEKQRKQILNAAKRSSKVDTDTGGGAGGGGGTNPWGGNAPAESTDYATWDVNELVARREQMDKFKNVLKPDTDIRAVLAEDKALMKALDNGLKEDWKSVLGWYNTERKKIQEELKSERFSTNEGHWRDEKQGRSRKNHFRESDYALAELDRYYSKRKEELEKARIEENMSEELFNRQAELLEQEHLERRSKLRETFTAGNTKEEQEMVKQFREWWSKLEKEGKLDEVPWATVESEWAKALASEIGRNNLKAQQDLTQMQQITVKHLNKIADIIAKERPYDGIVDNLRKNLTEMDILFSDMEKKGATDPATLVKEQTTRLQFLLSEAETAYQSSIDDVLKRMADAGMTAWAEEIGKSDAMKNALMAQLQTVYDEIQDAIKKEASQIKKHTDIWWNDLMPGQDTSRKGGFEKMLSRLGLQEDQVKRANALIGAGTASERVADKLAIKQMQIRLQMQQVYYQKMRQMWDDRIRSLREQGKEIDAQHAEISKQLSLSEEQKKLDEQRVAIANQLEESQNRLYTELKEWGDLLANSMRDLMEANHAGDKEYYNELAKLNLTGKGGPGAGTYVVIDKEGTEDATAHYEYLSEREALERQHEIEIENARAEAWKKMMDDLNAKMNEQITDWMNAALQNQSIDANTSAVNLNNTALNSNTQAMAGLTGQLAQGITIRKDNTGDTTNDHGLNGLNGLTDNSQQSVMFNEGVTPGMTWALTDDQLAAEQAQLDQRVQMQIDAAEKVRMANEAAFHSTAKTEGDSDKQMVKSTQSTFAKMTAAANLYGIAYQTMSNDNLSASEKFQMFALQAAGQAAIGMLTTNLFQEEANQMVKMPGILGKLLGEMPYPAAMATYAAVTALLGGLMGMAVSKVAKSKSQIAQVTGASASAGKLATGMLTYAEGNVNEFTDPGSLTPGRQYNVDGRDGRTYRARYMGEGAKTHITNGPEFHLVGEKGREAIIDAHTTRNIQLNEPEIWRSIQTLYNGGSLRHSSRRRGVRAYAEGNIDEFVEMENGSGFTVNGSGLTPEMASQMQAALDRNSAVMEVIVEKGIKAIVSPYGPDGIVAGYDKAKKEAKRHGEKYL